MKFFLHLLLVTIGLNTYSQAHKTYSGDYKGGGTASYTYFENDKYERIFDGDFSATIGLGVWGNIPLKVKGEFKNGMKNGEWIFNYDKSDTYISGYFKNGYKDGLWEVYYKHNDKRELGVKANYKNGVLVGDYYFNYYVSDSPISGKSKVIGHFNTKGKKDGVWNIKYWNKENILKYKDGILYWRLVRNFQTGEVFINYDNTSFVNLFFNNYDSITKTSIIKGIKYTIDTMKVKNHPLLEVYNENWFKNNYEYDPIADSYNWKCNEYLYEIQEGEKLIDQLRFKIVEYSETEFAKKQYQNSINFGIKYLKKGNLLLSKIDTNNNSNLYSNTLLFYNEIIECYDSATFYFEKAIFNIDESEPKEYITVINNNISFLNQNKIKAEKLAKEYQMYISKIETNHKVLSSNKTEEERDYYKEAYFKVYNYIMKNNSNPFDFNKSDFELLLKIQNHDVSNDCLKPLKKAIKKDKSISEIIKIYNENLK